MITGVSIGLLVRFEVEHFVLSACVGALVYWLTSIILSLIISSRISHRDSYIYHCSLLVALSYAVLVHILEDYFLRAF